MRNVCVFYYTGYLIAPCSRLLRSCYTCTSQRRLGFTGDPNAPTHLLSSSGVCVRARKYDAYPVCLRVRACASRVCASGACFDSWYFVVLLACARGDFTFDLYISLLLFCLFVCFSFLLFSFSFFFFFLFLLFSSRHVYQEERFRERAHAHMKKRRRACYEREVSTRNNILLSKNIHS